MQVLLLLVLGTGAAASASSSAATNASTTPDPGFWGQVGLGFSGFGKSLKENIQKGLRDAIAACGPTATPSPDWGKTRFGKAGDRLTAWWSDLGSVFQAWRHNITATHKRLTWRLGSWVAGLGGHNIDGLVAQAAAASLAQAADPLPTVAPANETSLAWFVFGFLVLFLAFLCGAVVAHWFRCPRHRRRLPGPHRADPAPPVALYAIALLALCSAVDGSRTNRLLQSSRACRLPNMGLLFGNCCNETDIVWCTGWVCWTAPGCSVCTERDGCWTSIGGGVSVRPATSSAEAKREAMDLFGFVGWCGVLAEGLGLGEYYAAGLVAGVYLVGGSHVPDLVCNVTCPQAEDSWWWRNAPTLAALWTFVQSVPAAVWSLIEAMPLLFGSYILFSLACGRWVQVILLLVSVPGALGACPVTFRGLTGGSTTACRPEDFVGNNTICDCPFGLVVRNFNSSYAYLDLNFSCPESFFGHNEIFWTCGWGSWWWQHNNVERPYSHPYMPPSPFTAICYLTTNRTEIHNGSLLVYSSGYGLDNLGGAPITTCILDRRPDFCGDCLGGCFYEDGRHDRGFGVCGGGVRDGPWWFLPLATLRFGGWFSPEKSWVVPDDATARRLASKYRDGVGCGVVSGLINCWLCNVPFTTTGNVSPPDGLWYPLPGEPTDICVNPQRRKQSLPWSPGWYSALEFASDLITGKLVCQAVPGHFPVCAHSAWFPKDGGFVVISEDTQVFGGGPRILRSFLGLLVALVVFMATAGARVVPALLMLSGFIAFGFTCYPPCAYAVCNYYLCWTSGSCAVWVEGSLCVGNGTVAWCGSGAFLPGAAVSALAPAYVVWAGSVVTGAPRPSALWVTWQALKPVEPALRDVVVCGSPGVAGSVWFDAASLAFLLVLGLLPVAWRWACASLAFFSTFRFRSLFPVRWLSVALHMSMGSPPTCLAILAVAWWLWAAVPGAEAALARPVIGGPALGWALRLPTWVEASLGCLCVLAYFRCVGRARLAALAAYKISRGLGGFLLLSFLLTRGPDRGVLGAELCFPLFEADWSLDDAWWFCSISFSSALFLCALYTPLGRRAKLRLYAKWCRVYCWCEFGLSVSPLGIYSQHLGGVGCLWLVAGVLAPVPTTWAAVVVVCACGTLDLIDWLFEVVLCSRPSTSMLVAWANTCHAWFNDAELRAFLRRRWLSGEVLYDHCGQVAADLRDRAIDLGCTLEPLALGPEDLRAVHDDSFVLTCGRWYDGRPVVARCGASVLIGQAQSVESLPPGYTLTAPFVTVRKDIGWLSILKVSMTGRSDTPGQGQIASLRTALGTSMGCGVSGVLYATFHGTKGRALATPQGPRSPFWTSPSEDVVCYPLQPPMTSLDPCGCNSSSRWVLTRAGSLVHGTAHGEDRVHLDCPTPINKLKGASGTPVLCDCGHAVGMMVGVSGRSGVGESVRFVVPWRVQPGDVKPAALPEFPTVPSKGYKEVPYIAPTGSGKSTKFPAKLAQDGHSVLVLNPSVVTTKAMHGYMKQLTGKAPNTYAGTGRGAMQVKTGSKITYATYGRFLVNPQGFLQGKDVVICDECHATDGTSVLGMGVVRSLAQAQGVKLLVFATATPPGTQFAAHKNITEVALGGDGDVPFYGLSLKSENYLKGRHLIFCHSKVECQRVAEELAQRGAHTVTYWRGKSQDCLTPDADLVVVATDAISTGYTGNFATVTDCCSVVQEDVDVDLNPTFSIGVSVGPADAALRIQRRGRCGRGAPGTYYYTVKGAPPSGVCGSSVSWAAAEAAFMWYGMLDADVTRYLECYQECPYTARLQGAPGDAVRVLGCLRPYFHCAEVTQEALRDTQWPMLTGIQRHVCLESGSAAPSDDVRWQGVNGTGSTPLLYRLGTVTVPTTSHPLALKMAAALGDTSYHDVSLGPILLAGAAVAAACAVADATGVLVLAGTWEVCGGGAPVYPGGSLETQGEVAGSEPIPADALQEVVTSLDWTFLTTVWGALASGGTQALEGAQRFAASAGCWWNEKVVHLVHGIPTQGPGARVLGFLEQHLTALLAGGLAVSSARSSPPFAALAGLVCGAAAAVPQPVVWLLVCAATAASSMVGGPVAGAGVGAGVWLGSMLGGLSWVDMILGVAAGYEACVSCCALVLDLFDGRVTLANALPCLTGLLCPGSALAGVAMALILRSAATGDVTTWMNRLLSMLPKSNVLPDGFFAEKKDIKLGDMVRSLSLVQRIRAMCEATKEPEYIYTSATWVGRLIEFAGVIVRMLLDFAGRWLPNPLPRIPIYSCQAPYRGPWEGVGSAVTRCGCGRSVTLTVRPGGGPVVEASSFCSSSWGDPKGFPINHTTKYSGTLLPCVRDAQDVTFLVGLGHVVRLVGDGLDWYLQETSLASLSTGLILSACVRGPIEVAGKLVSTRIGQLTTGRFVPGQSVTYNGLPVTLPHRLSFNVKFPNMPFAPSLLPQVPDDGEGLAPALGEPVEGALEAAEEAIKAADAVVATAVPLMEKAFEARRAAELAEWTAREKGLGKVLGRNMVAQYAVRSGALDPEVLEWLDSQPDAVGSPEQAASVKVKLEESRVHPGLSAEPITEGFSAPTGPEEVGAIAGALRHGVGVATDLATGAVSAIMRGVVLGTRTILGAQRVASKVRVGEVVPAALSTPKVNVLVTWFCDGHRQVGRVSVPEDHTVAEAARAACVPWCHPHVYRWGGVPISPDVQLKNLGTGEVALVATCPAVKAKTVMRNVVHKCCGADESFRKHFRRDIPVKVVGSLCDRGKPATFYDGDKELTGEEELGDVGSVITVVHEEPCGLSYVWSGVPIQVDRSRQPPVSRPLTAHLRARADKVYVTDPQNVHARIAKVTIEQRVAQEDRYFKDAYNLALAKANKVLSPGYSYEEAVAKVRPGSAKGHVAKLTVADLKTPRGKEEVLKCLDGIRTGTVQAHFMLRPKAEVFPQTRPTFKPPRLIVYPSLEFRVAEKMILGDPAVVAKAVLGRAYGFQYAPHERARVLVDMWRSKKVPVAYTVDGTCFDSTVTPEDIGREAEIFAKASPDPVLVRQLHTHYAGSPMVDPSGNIVGYRHCRASGTLTTSAGNSITCYLKVSAACRKAGLTDPSFLIHGDDVLIVCEKKEYDESDALGAALASYGYDCVPTRHADLTSAESCSACLDVCRTVRGVKHVLRCDMRRGLGRAMAEYGDPIGTSWGYTLNYPTHPVSMYVLLPLLLQTALNNGAGVGQPIVVDVRGNSLELPLNRLGSAIRTLHGTDALAVTGHSATVLQETGECLHFFGMRSLNHWRRVRRKVKVRLLRAGREWAALARELLWDPGDCVPPVLRVDRYEIPEDLWQHSWEGLRLVPTEPHGCRWLTPALLCGVGLLLLIL